MLNCHYKIKQGLKVKLLLFIALILISPLNHAEDIQYVSDQLVITLRTGQGSTYQIIRTLPSGTKLDVLEMTDTGYARVRTENGDEGWIRSQYLSPEPIARLKLQAAEKNLGKLKTENTRLQEETKKLRKQRHELKSKNKDLLARVKTAESQLSRLGEVAAKPILLDKENRKLQQQNISLEKKLQMMAQENQILKDRSQREWFIAGAIVLLGGIFLGLLLPKIRWKKRNTWK
ncbi:MAG TPA: TIGR04211 family SH3 domain-containing protein [Gammaproteobacteria bacterium]|nr:TIGR04211 family SH3 domain-containing protein [Gammaproteobacteria bacterium]